MQAELKIHLNDTIVINLNGTTPSEAVLVRSKPDHFTVQAPGGEWIHYPYTSILSVREFLRAREVETANGTAEVKLVVEVRTRSDGGNVYLVDETL